ncbi:MAG: Fe(3+) ABC transporter substrate-binding protein [Rhizobiales bacterium]|nr:Fe(3+) ABC transporter substrate-binding protein [Hyphomicrobiales bacterium]
MSLASRLAALLGSTFLLASAANADGTVNVYSYRQPQLVQPLFDAFQKETGIEVKMVFAEKGLIERMEQEGTLSPVDVLLTADVGRLVEAADKGLAQPVTSDKINGSVPASLRDPGNQWFGLTMRARVVYASKDRVKRDTISYEELADPKFKGKICTRPGDHPYNLGLISAMIAKRGEAATKTWLEGLKANLAVKPSGNDRAQAKSVAAGECDIAIGNTYYMGLMMTNEKEPEQKEWAAASRLIFPSSAEMGTHVNISGMLLAKNAPHRDDALKLMEFLASDESQALYASQNFEYPVNPSIKPSETVAAWGTFTPDSLNIAEVARNQKIAAQLVNEVHFND